MIDILLSLAAAVLWGLAYFVLSYLTDLNYFTIQIIQSTLVSLLSMLSVAIQFYFFRHTLANQDPSFSVIDVLYDQFTFHKSGLLIVYSLCTFIAGTCYLFAFNTTVRPSLVTILSSLYVVTTVVLLVTIKREAQYYNLVYFVIGLCLCVAGTCLITVSKR